MAASANSSPARRSRSVLIASRVRISSHGDNNRPGCSSAAVNSTRKLDSLQLERVIEFEPAPFPSSSGVIVFEFGEKEGATLALWKLEVDLDARISLRNVGGEQ